MNLLELNSVTCGYGKTKILNNISISVPKGDFLGIIGPNGAGKTTLFRLITGFIKPWEGDILFNGKELTAISRLEFAKQTATMPQFLDAFFSFTVEDFIAMGRFPHLKRWSPLSKRDKDAIESALVLTDIPHLRKRILNELSGGERQRVLLAQALAQEPALLLLDEPTAHLDIGHQVEIFDLIRKLNRENNLTVITVLHDLNIASEYCKNLILMKGGEIFATGNPGKVLTYQNIESVYNTVVIVMENPFSFKPNVIPVSKDHINKIKNGDNENG